jgi:RNA polymerase sigma-70 factor (ECF subfamily)
MLQTVLGLDASIIAESFLTSPAAMSQRLVRAKRRIRETGIPFRLPERADLPERLDAVLNAIYAAFATCRLDDSIDQLAVLNAIYAAFATGWADPVGLDARRHGLVEEAIWLGRVAVDLLPQEPETLGLLALMLHAQARRSARRDGDGAYIPLSQQDTACWDGGAIEEAEGLLRAASALAREPKAIGRFQLEAAVQSAHAARRIAGRTDWQAIVALYDGLVALTGSPIVAVNRAAAMAESESAEAGLAALDGLMPEPKLAGYQPYWALRADLLARLGHNRDAEAAYVRALALESNPAVRRYLEARRDGLPTGP